MHNKHQGHRCGVPVSDLKGHASPSDAQGAGVERCPPVLAVVPWHWLLCPVVCKKAARLPVTTLHVG